MTMFWIGFNLGMGFFSAQLFCKLIEGLVDWYYDRKGKSGGN